MIKRDLHLKGKIGNKNKAILREEKEETEEDKKRHNQRRMKIIIK